MTHPEHLESLHGLPVFTLPAPGTPEAERLPDPGSVAWRLDCSYRHHGSEHPEDGYWTIWQRFLDSVDTERVTALVIGPWWNGGVYDDVDDVIHDLVEAKDRFPLLRALFLGDVSSEEGEISWLMMSDVTPLLTSFPALEHLGIRGGGCEGAWLELDPVRHEALRVLRIESGGLSGQVTESVGESELPALDHLELWLGTQEFGGDATVDDLAPLLAGDGLPALRHLGLQGSEIQDEIAEAVASAPVVSRLTSLSLSMGTLSDTGAEALLAGQPLTHLGHLDLHHHFLTDPVLRRVRDTLEPAGVTVDLSEGKPPGTQRRSRKPEPEPRRYGAITE